MAAETEPRLPLSRDRILRTALDLADESGIEALTMRKLGQALGFEAMSLYNHVTNKDDVLDGILDLVLAETEPPSPAGDWDAAVRRSEVSVLVGMLERMIPADEYPYLHEHAEQHLTEGPLHEVSAFELSLDLILDGLAKVHDAE